MVMLLEGQTLPQTPRNGAADRYQAGRNHVEIRLDSLCHESAKLRDRGSEILCRVSRMIGEDLTDDDDYGALLERLLANGHDISRFRIDARLTH